MRNAVIDFSKMTTSVVALITVETRYGKPVIWDEVQYEGDIPEGWGALDQSSTVCSPPSPPPSVLLVHIHSFMP